MSQIATLATIQPILNPAQSKVLAVMLAGGTVTLAAERAGVARETVHRWLREPLFLAELNGGKAEMMAKVRADLRVTAVEAVRFLREAMTSDDSNKALKLKISLAVLKMVGADEPELIGPTDPDEIALAQRELDDDLEDRDSLTPVYAALGQPGPRALP